MALPAAAEQGGERVFQLLQIEDNPGDAQMTRICLNKSGLRFNLSQVEDGVSALAFLRRQAPYADAPVPAMVLLDLNLPGMDGFEVLSKIRNDDVLRVLPVTIFSTSANAADIRRAYHHGCSSYLVKPPSFEGMVRTINAFVAYWFSAARLPPPR